LRRRQSTAAGRALQSPAADGGDANRSARLRSANPSRRARTDSSPKGRR